MLCEGIVSEFSYHPERMGVPCSVWFLARGQWLLFAINPISMVCGSACPPGWVQGEAAQLHKTLKVSFKVSAGNATCRLSNLFLLNYAPLWQNICRLHARWREFSVSASGLVNITISSQGYLLIPDGMLRSLYHSSNLWGLLFPKKWECFNVLHIFPISMPICESILTE